MSTDNIYYITGLNDWNKRWARETFRRKQDDRQFIITTAALKWQSISVPTKNLMLFEEVES